ncbi:Nn.00g059990.m01.CDS01 [Neocucurbitaria sp. VM-36]
MAFGTTLPTWPAILFTYLEPISLLLGVHAAFSNPTSFITKQLPVTHTAALSPIPASAYVLAYSLGSVFLLFAFLNILCTVVTRDVTVTKYYLAILACGDVGHLYANYKGMGPHVFWNFSNYNEFMIGNVWITVFLWVNRIATLAGVFGRVRRQT